MTTGIDNTISPLGQSFGDLEDIIKTIDFGKWIVNILDDAFTHDNIFLEDEDFVKLYQDSKLIFLESLEFYDKLLQEPDNSIHAKILIELLYKLYQAGLTNEVGAVKRSLLEKILAPVKNLTRIPIKKLLELLGLVNIYLGSLAKAMQSAEALDEAKKYGEHILNTMESDLEKEILIKEEPVDFKKGGSFEI